LHLLISAAADRTQIMETFAVAGGTRKPEPRHDGRNSEE